MLKKIACSVLLLQSSVSFAQTVQLDELYQRYVEADYMSSELEEFNTKIEFKSIIAELDENLAGDLLLRLAGPNEPNAVIARATSSNAQVKKFSQLQEGDIVKMQCLLQFTMNADYLALSECEIK